MSNESDEKLDDGHRRFLEKHMNKTFTVEVLRSDEDPDDCMIPIPDELMKEQGWNIGDELSFEINTDYSIIMRKSNDNDPVDIRSSIIRLDKPEE